MARRGLEVTVKDVEAGRVPESAVPGVTLVELLARRGVLEKVADLLKIRRKGGYCGFDVGLVLLLYFASGVAVGLKEFWEVIRSCNCPIAATAGRTRLASPSSVSRALSAVELKLLRPVSARLLAEFSGIDAVLRHPSVLTYDVKGDGWQVFDFDPTVSVLRQRALPKGDDLPEARRKAAGLAAPGYTGRKRGDVQVRRGVLQHAGSSAWLQAGLGPGNSDSHAELEAALGVLVETCQRLDHSLLHAVLRMDGEFGWVPFLSACRARGVRCITRLTRPELLEQPDVLSKLREGTWEYVPDSGCEPRRSALDLGIVTVPPGQDTRTADGTTYEPVAVRVVVSRYPRTGKAEHGRVIDGWQYELFAVDLDPASFPAPEAVALFFGRASLENRFAQEDREVGLDQILSYHLPGQEFAVIIGLWVWNLRLVLGFEQQPPPDIRPRQEARVVRVDTWVVTVETATAEAQVPSTPPPAEAAEPAQTEPSPEVERRPEASPPTKPAVDAAATVAGEDELLRVLGSLDWDHTLRHHPGWSWDRTTGALRCGDRRELVLTTVRKDERTPGRTGIVFCRPSRGCEQCGSRPGCLRSSGTRSSKHIELAVPSEIANHLRELLARRRQSPPIELSPPGQQCTGTSQPEQPSIEIPTESREGLVPRTPARKRPRPPFAISPCIPLATAAVLAVLPPLFLPAAARRLLHLTTRGATLLVEVVLPPPAPPAPVLLAGSVEERQHRRKTWAQNLARYALDPKASVRATFTGGDALRRLLPEDR
jgi:hypothetical protein